MVDVLRLVSSWSCGVAACLRYHGDCCRDKDNPPKSPFGKGGLLWMLCASLVVYVAEECRECALLLISLPRYLR